MAPSESQGSERRIITIDAKRVRSVRLLMIRRRAIARASMDFIKTDDACRAHGAVACLSEKERSEVLRALVEDFCGEDPALAESVAITAGQMHVSKTLAAAAGDFKDAAQSIAKRLGDRRVPLFRRWISNPIKMTDSIGFPSAAMDQTRLAVDYQGADGILHPRCVKFSARVDGIVAHASVDFEGGEVSEVAMHLLGEHSLRLRNGWSDFRNYHNEALAIRPAKLLASEMERLKGMQQLKGEQQAAS